MTQPRRSGPRCAACLLHRPMPDSTMCKLCGLRTARMQESRARNIQRIAEIGQAAFDAEAARLLRELF